MQESKNLDIQPVIEPYGLYSADWLKSQFSIRYISSLRTAGLRSVGDRYLGIDIIKAHRKVAQLRNRQTRENNEKVDKESGYSGCRIQPVAISGEPNSLESQLEKCR